MIRGLLLALLATSLGAQPDLRLGPERPLGDPRPGPWASSAHAIVPEGDAYVVFWTAPAGGSSSDLMATRIAADGRRIGAPVTLVQSRRAQSLAAARAAANRYLVAYSGADGTFVFPVGAGLRPLSEARRITDAVNDLDLACNAHGCALGWRDRDSAVRAEMLDADAATTAGPIAISEGAYALSLAAARDTFLATMSRVSSGTALVMFTGNGTFQRTIIREEDECAAAGVEQRYAIACSDGQTIASLAISETDTDSQSQTIVTSRSERILGNLSVAATPDVSLVSFALIEPSVLITGMVPPQVLSSVRIGANGAAIGTAAVDVAAQPMVNWQMDSATNGRDFLVAWNHSPSNFPSEITAHVSAIAADGRVIRHEPLRVGPEDQIGDAAARSTADTLAVWREPSTLSGRFTLNATRLDRGDRIELARDVFAGQVAAASDGRDYLAVWTEIEDSSAVVRTAAISGLDGNATRGLEIAGFGMPLLTWTGSSYATVLWRNGLRLLRLAADGTYAGEFSITPIARVPDWVAIAAAADRTVVVWNTDGGTSYAMFQTSGTLLVPPTLLNTRSSAPLAVAGNADEFVVLSGNTPTTATRIYTSGRIFGSETIVDPRIGSQAVALLSTSQGFLAITRANDGVTAATLVRQGVVHQTVALTDPPSRLVAASAFDGGGRASLLFLRRNDDNVQGAAVRELSIGPFLRRRAVR
jgi:hypothetical protein